MKEEIRKEIIKLYGDKGIVIESIEKRLHEKSVFGADGEKLTSDKYIYDVDVTFPGHETFPVSILSAADVKRKIEETLMDWGIVLK